MPDRKTLTPFEGVLVTIRSEKSFFEVTKKSRGHALGAQGFAGDQYASISAKVSKAAPETPYVASRWMLSG